MSKNYYNHASNKGKILEGLYKKGTFEFDVEKTNLEEKRPVVYADAEELVEAVVSERSLIGNHIIKVMADGSQGIFKICFSILPENYLESELDSSSDDDDVQRKLYSEGGSISHEAKPTSVKKVILLCIVPKIKESYENIKRLFDLNQINNIPFKFSSDFKLILIVNGQQTASSTYPCPYCFVSLQDLRQNEGDKNSISSNESENMGHLKTYGDLKKDFDKYQLLGKDKKKAKECHSTINQPLFEENSELCVIEKCVVPELHVLQGFVNHLFWNGLVPLLGEDRALLWPKKMQFNIKKLSR